MVPYVDTIGYWAVRTKPASQVEEQKEKATAGKDQAGLDSDISKSQPMDMHKGRQLDREIF